MEEPPANRDARMNSPGAGSGDGGGSSRPLRPARVSSLVRTCAKSHAAAPHGLTADGDCYDPVVN